MNKISLFLTLLISINLYEMITVSANSDYAKQEYSSNRKISGIFIFNQESPELYYNLANSFALHLNFKAIYYYEKALKIKPI